MEKLNLFVNGDESRKVIYINTEQVIEGVECDIYSFQEDKSKDLGIIRIQAGHRTPQQKILDGDETIEGYISGEGSLFVQSESGDSAVYDFGRDKENAPVIVIVGEIMQWKATTDSLLTVFEICTPPYQAGRFENL